MSCEAFEVWLRGEGGLGIGAMIERISLIASTVKSHIELEKKLKDVQATRAPPVSRKNQPLRAPPGHMPRPRGGWYCDCGAQLWYCKCGRLQGNCNCAR